METIIKYGLKDINRVIDDIRPLLALKNTFAFVGPIGVGKTTFIKKLIHSYGVPEHDVVSPTFNYVNIYKTKSKTIYHFDLYRLKNKNEFLEQGFDEYLNDENGIIIIEWPEIIIDLIKNKALLITIEYIDEHSRELIVKPI